MEYYLYLLQIFGGGNPKINEVINAYGSAKDAYRKINGGDMSLIPANRLPNVRKASLEKSKMITDYCRSNNIGIITIDDEKYPIRLKNIFNPPVLLFTAGDIGCLDSRLSVAVVGPRQPSDYAVRIAENICYNLAQCNVALVSGFARGIDRIAHNNCIRHKKPTAAVLACGITVDYPKDSFELRREITDNGGVIISELLPDTSCNPDYFKFRNRIISGLSQGTVVIDSNNASGSLITANHAFEQDRELFFTVPQDTLDNSRSKIIRYLRDGAHPVYDFYDIINEFYPSYSSLIDDTYLDKEQLTSFISRTTAAESKEKEPKPTASVDKRIKKTTQAEKKPVDTHRFRITSVTDKEKEIDYVKVTPESVLKKRRKTASKALTSGTGNTIASSDDLPKTEEEQEDISADVKIDTEPASSEMTGRAADILGIISACDGVTLDKLLSDTDMSFGELSEQLADLEIDGVITCEAGGIYTVKKER